MTFKALRAVSCACLLGTAGVLTAAVHSMDKGHAVSKKDKKGMGERGAHKYGDHHRSMRTKVS